MIRPYNSVMLDVLLKPLVAVIQLFALYVLMHGHYSPGGGFQAGVLFACSMILPILVRGERESLLVLSPKGSIILAAIGVMIYASVGIAAVFFGGAVLDYAMLPLAQEPAARRSLGILLIEVGVTLGVAGAVMSIFYALYEDMPKEDVAGKVKQ